MNFFPLDLSQDPTDMEPLYVVEVLVHLTKESARNSKVSAVQPCPPGEKGEMQVKLIDYICPEILYVYKWTCSSIYFFQKEMKIIPLLIFFEIYLRDFKRN